MPLLCSHPSLILYDAAATAVVVVKSSSRGRKIGRERKKNEALESVDKETQQKSKERERYGARHICETKCNTMRYIYNRREREAFIATLINGVFHISSTSKLKKFSFSFNANEFTSEKKMKINFSKKERMYYF
jgi:hypothetical protein